MKVLVCLSRFPYPLNKGDKLRAFYQIKELAKEHEVYLFCFNRTKVSQSDLEILKQYCKEIHIEKLFLVSQCFSLFKSFFTSLPLQVAFFTTKKAKRSFFLFSKKVKADVSYFQFVRTAEYAKQINGKCVLDFQDCLSVNMERRAMKSNRLFKNIFLYEARKLRNYEDTMFDCFNATTIITDIDRDLLSSDRKIEVNIIENGVGDSFLNYTQKKDKKFDVIFSGNMSYAPNVDAARFLINEIMPMVWAKFPETKVVLAGSNPTNYIKSLACDRVVVTGWVDDMKEYYAQSRIFIAPMRIGTGLQNKLLEAMALSLPCITTPLANSALKSLPDKEILVASEASLLAENIVKLLTDEMLYGSIAANGHKFVEENYNWQYSTEKLIKIFQTC
ncbi:MAG: glycosyltransferase [Bacteroidales bacterium]|nr:glycosyltransferase [Bacteroidales bacterium]